MMKRPLYALAAAAVWLASCAPPLEEYRQPPPVAQPPVGLVAPKPVVTLKGVIPPQTATIKVALLLPLSGESLSVGTSMLDAATMALYDYYIAMPSSQIHSQIVLLPKDIGNTPAEAARAAQVAIDQGATFIVGPLFSQSVSTVAPIARAHNIPMLTFSNTKAVAAPDVFLFGFLPEQQIERMAEYAFLNKYQRVALLAPNDAYGQKVEETLVASYGKKGGAVTPVELYAPSPANINAAVARLAAYNNANEDRRFEALFIADGGYHLKNIIAGLKKTNINTKNVRLLGTGLWDDPEITSMPEMEGAWFSSSPPEAHRNFERRFVATYGYKPARLASLSYDAITALISISVPREDGLIDVKALTHPQGFHNLANGRVRLLENGQSDRKLHIMEVTPSGFKIIDPASPVFVDKKDSATQSQ